MTGKSERIKSILFPMAVAAALIVFWTVVWKTGAFHESAFPSPLAVLRGFGEEIRSGRLFNDLITSLFRVCCGFAIAVALGVPMGLWLGQKLSARLAFLPIINFFRNLSPLAWIPFAILWFGVGDSASIFLIFLAAFFPVALATMAAVANIPAVYFRVAQDYGLRGIERLTQVTLPAIMPQVITTLRVTAGLGMACRGRRRDDRRTRRVGFCGDGYAQRAANRSAGGGNDRDRINRRGDRSRAGAIDEDSERAMGI